MSTSSCAGALWALADLFAFSVVAPLDALLLDRYRYVHTASNQASR